MYEILTGGWTFSLRDTGNKKRVLKKHNTQV